MIREYENLPSMLCYPSQINQVFLHIINNAIDAIRDDSDYSEAPEIRIQTKAIACEKIHISITNTGKTIPPDHHKRIFDPFFTTKPVGSGTGLGLFASYSIIQNHGGTIAVSSPSENETTFDIILPYPSD